MGFISLNLRCLLELCSVFLSIGIERVENNELATVHWVKMANVATIEKRISCFNVKSHLPLGTKLI